MSTFYRTKPRLPVLERGNPLVDGLILDVPFSERSGLRVRDATGLLRKDWTYDGFTADDWQMSPYGPSMIFGLSNSRGRRLWLNPTQLQNNVLEVVNGVSFEAIWRFNNSNQFGFLVSYAKTGGARNYYITRNNSSLEIRIAKSGGGAVQLDHSGITTGTWMHTIVTYNRVIGRSYLNGVLKTEDAETDTIRTDATLNQFSIGADRDDWNGGDLYGNIALFRMWKRGLTTQEVSQLYANPWRLYQDNRFLRSIAKSPEQIEDASTSPTNLILFAATPTPTYIQIDNAEVDPIGLVTNPTTTTAIYIQENDALSDLINLQITLFILTASYIQVGVAETEPFHTEIAIPTITATYIQSEIADVQILSILITGLTSTAAYIETYDTNSLTSGIQVTIHSSSATYALSITSMVIEVKELKSMISVRGIKNRVTVQKL
jgi:hypothetical protein